MAFQSNLAMETEILQRQAKLPAEDDFVMRKVIQRAINHMPRNGAPGAGWLSSFLLTPALEEAGMLTDLRTPRSGLLAAGGLGPSIPTDPVEAGA